MRKLEDCEHRYLEMDDVGETVHCIDCKRQVSSYWALGMLRDLWGNASRRYKAQLSQLQTDQSAVLHLKAAKQAETVWRSHNYVPGCPHCRRGILLTDGFGSIRIAKAFEQGLRVREQADQIKLTPVRPPEPVRAPKRKSAGKPLPKWQDAPEWAQWLIQDPESGKLHWASDVLEFLPVGQILFAGTYPLSDTPIKQSRPVAEGSEQ
jgi:hypothetical protein